MEYLTDTNAMLLIDFIVIITLYVIFRFIFAPRNSIYFYVALGFLLPQISLIFINHLAIQFYASHNCQNGLYVFTNNLFLSWFGLLFGLFYYHFKVKKLYKEEEEDFKTTNMKQKITIFLFLLTSFFACISCQNCKSCLIDAKKDMPFFEQINEKILTQAQKQLSALSWKDIQGLLSEKELNVLKSKFNLKQITYTFNGKYTEYVLQSDKEKQGYLYCLLYFENEFDKNDILNDVPYGEMRQDFIKIDKNWVYISVLMNYD